jgi:hypothetical protein
MWKRWINIVSILENQGQTLKQKNWAKVKRLHGIKKF